MWGMAEELNALASTLPPASERRPAISQCEGGRDTTVFIESENSDGWIACDHTIEVRR